MIFSDRGRIYPGVLWTVDLSLCTVYLKFGSFVSMYLPYLSYILPSVFFLRLIRA